MGVDVDKAGGDDLASSVKGTLGALPEIADRDNPAVADTDVAAVSGDPRAVDDRAVPDKQIIFHDGPSFLLHLESSSCALRLLKT